MLIQQPPIRALGYVVSIPWRARTQPGRILHAHKRIPISPIHDDPITMEYLLYDTLHNDLLLEVLFSDTIDKKACEEGMPNIAFRVLWYHVPRSPRMNVNSEQVLAEQVAHYGVVVEVAVSCAEWERWVKFLPNLVTLLDILFGTAFQGRSMIAERVERLERLEKFMESQEEWLRPGQLWNHTMSLSSSCYHNRPARYRSGRTETCRYNAS
jgi:hypothetical protein